MVSPLRLQMHAVVVVSNHSNIGDADIGIGMQRSFNVTAVISRLPGMCDCLWRCFTVPLHVVRTPMMNSSPKSFVVVDASVGSNSVRESAVRAW